MEQMTAVNKTLYIPLYGKAYVSRRGLFLRDEQAEAIWAAEGFPLKGKAASKWLAFYLGIRAAVFDAWLAERLSSPGEVTVLHLGCGLDSRCLRVARGAARWYDVDFPEVIAQRRRHYGEDEHYTMVGADVRRDGWLDGIEGRQAAVVMEGVSMYLRREELQRLMAQLEARFDGVQMLMDAYTPLAARLSRRRNPVGEVGVEQVFGLDDPQTVSQGELRFLQEHEMMPQGCIDELSGSEKKIFAGLYAGKMAGKLYRLYEYRKG